MSFVADELEYCPICYSTGARIYVDKTDRKRFLCDCPICGRYISNEEIDLYDTSKEYDVDEIASFLFYNGDKAVNDRNQVRSKIYSFDGGMIENDSFYKGLDMPEETDFLCIPINAQTVKSWVPKSFSEKIDKILLYLEEQTPRFGEILHYNENEIVSLFFLKRHELIHGFYNEPLIAKDIISQTNFFAEWISNENIIEMSSGVPNSGNLIWNTAVHGNMTYMSLRSFAIALTPAGYKRIDNIERENISNRNVFIAMQFRDTDKLRECIKEGITKAGYTPILIDEVEHNNQIMPEILYNIRKSLFVVAELTHRNPGAYLEEGYALGYGKEVIQVCKRSEISKLHFDISQKSTVVWDVEDDIPDKLCARIKATME